MPEGEAALVAEDVALAELEVGVSEPFGVRHGAQGDEDDVGREAGSVREVDGLHVIRALEPLDLGTAVEPDALVGVQASGPLADDRAEDGHRVGGNVDERDLLEPALAQCRCDLAADEPGADDDDPRLAGHRLA